MREGSGDDAEEADPWLERGVAFDASILLREAAK
jgi:hypothetical protein